MHVRVWAETPKGASASFGCVHPAGIFCSGDQMSVARGKTWGADGQSSFNGSEIVEDSQANSLVSMSLGLNKDEYDDNNTNWQKYTASGFYTALFLFFYYL